MTAHPATWLACPVPQREPRHRLVCFPHAGGSASFFHDWGHHLADIEVHAVRYPGRADRIHELPPTRLRRLAREIADAVEPLAGRPLLAFGHGMGAVVALETARFLESHGVRLAHLFASGSRDGWPDEQELAAPHGDERLVDLGGTDPGLAADPVFQELVLPYIRSDDRMFHAYVFTLEPTLHCPVTTIVGDADGGADCRPWSKLTDGGFREEVVPGDHFYLTADPPYDLLREAAA
jgi:surfactin synthase thioesterase subunit